MVSKFALLTNLLLASAALAVPSSRLGASRSPRREIRQLQPNNRLESTATGISNVVYSNNWAGAVWEEGGIIPFAHDGTFTTVTGTFTVPTPSGSDGAATVWVGIDGATCSTASLQTGIYVTVSGGQVSYGAWSEWWPDYSYYFSGITIAAGDEIRTTVIAYSTASGVAVIENLTTAQTVTQNFTSGNTLCGQNAEWIVENFRENGTLVPLADFGTITFTSAVASGPSGTAYTPSGATLLVMEQNNQDITSVSTSGSTLTLEYI